MELNKWSASFEDVVKNLYGTNKTKQDSLIDGIMSPDVKLEQFSFSVQGRSSVKYIFSLRRILNKGKTKLENINFNPQENSAIASFSQELDINVANIPKLEYPAFTIFYLKEIEDDRWMICRIKDIIDAQNILRSIPFLGSFYDSFARPLAGAALVAIGSFSENNQSQLTYNSEAIPSNGHETLKEQRNNPLVCTEQYKSSIEKVGRKAVSQMNNVVSKK